jgi:hypothetical protein
MNNERRKRIKEITDQLENASLEIEQIKNDEQEYLDNMPESFQQGEKGSAAEETIQELESAESSIEEALSSLSNIS